jgi:hypothetical protein
MVSGLLESKDTHGLSGGPMLIGLALLQDPTEGACS